MRKLVAMFAAVLMAGGLLAACGGSSSKTGSGDDSTTTTAGKSSDGSSTDGSSSDSGDNDFSKLLAEANKERFKITYTDDSGDEQTYAQDGEGNSVLIHGDSKTFFSTAATINCTQNSGDWECTQSPISVGAVGNPFTSVLALSQNYIRQLGDRFGDTSTKTIAGREAECVSFSAKDLAGPLGGAIADKVGESLKASVTSCIDKETGVPLELSGTDESGEATTTIKVTKFGEPSDSDFTPPATPSTIPSISLPAGITLPSLPD